MKILRISTSILCQRSREMLWYTFWKFSPFTILLLRLLFVAPSARFYCNNMWGKFSFSPFEQFCMLYRLFWHDIVLFCGILNGRAKLVTIQFIYSKIVNACWVFCFTHVLLMLFYFPWRFWATRCIFRKTDRDSKKCPWQLPR